MSKKDGFEIEIGDIHSPVSEGEIDNPWETPYERQREEIRRQPVGGETELYKIPVIQERRRRDEFNNVNKNPPGDHGPSIRPYNWLNVDFVEPPRPKKKSPLPS